MNDIDSIKSRIRKLLNVAENDASTDGEIDNALRFAKSMMDQHHLSEADLAEEPEDQYKKAQAAIKARYWAVVGKRMHTWEGRLAMFVADFVGVGVYADHGIHKARKPNGLVIWDENGDIREGKAYCFYGAAEDAALSVEIYNDLWLCIRAMSRLKFGTCYQGDGGMYAQGFVAGLAERIAKVQKQDRLAANTSTAMVLIERRADLIRYKQRVGKDWLSTELKIKLGKSTRSRGARGSSGAFFEGRSDGRRAEISGDRKAKLN